MRIISIRARENGGRPGICDWLGDVPPEGFAALPPGYDESVFLAYNGFVNISYDDVLTSMTGNKEAKDANDAAFPVPVPTPQAPQITAAEVSDALCEMDAANDKRLSAIEDALCSLDSATNGGVTA